MNRTRSQPENHELSFTLDLTGMRPEDALQLVHMASAYAVRDLAVYGMSVESLVGAEAAWFPSLLHMQVTLEAEENSAPEKDRYLSVVLRSAAGEVITSTGIRSETKLQQLAQSLNTTVEALSLVQGHADLGRNYLVSSRDEVGNAARKMYRRGRAISDMYRGQSHHYITPDQLEETVKRLQRRRGHYYIRPNHTITPRSFYYREVMLERIPNFQAMWSTAALGVSGANLEPDLAELAASLDYRVTALLQVSDDLEEHAHEVADNGTRWEMLNLLQYFAMLATGLFDNLAWLTSIRYGFYREYMDDDRKRNLAILKIRKDANGQLLPNRFHYRIQNANPQLYNLIVSVQELMDVLYPIRDSVQHRFILGTTIWHNNNEGWSRVMIDLPAESDAALRRLEARTRGTLATWGAYPLGMDDELSIDPSTFARKTLLELLGLAQTALGLLSFPDMVAGNPALHAQVLQPRARR